MTRARILRLALSLTLAFLAVGLGGLSVYRKVQSFQLLGFEAVPSGGGVEVRSVERPETGLRPGDQILQVNAGDVPTHGELVERIRERAESELTVIRGDSLLQVHYRRLPFSPDIPYLLLCLIGAVYLAIGLYTLLRHGTGQGFLFYLWCLASAMAYLLTPTPPVDLGYASIYLFDTVAYLLLPALTVHLFLVFPAALPRESRLRRLIPFLYLPAAALITLYLDLMLTNGRWVFGRSTPERVALLDRVSLVYFLVLSALAVGVLFWRLRRRDSSMGWEQRRQMQWMAWGVAAGLRAVPGFLLRCRTRSSSHIPALLASAAVLPLALVPLTFAYAILRYKLWDIEVIARDTISWTLTLLLGIVGFSLVNLGINRGVAEELSFARTLLSFLSGLGIAGLLVPTRGVISSALERVHYRGAFGKRRALWRASAASCSTSATSAGCAARSSSGSRTEWISKRRTSTSRRAPCSAGCGRRARKRARRSGSPPTSWAKVSGSATSTGCPGWPCRASPCRCPRGCSWPATATPSRSRCGAGASAPSSPASSARTTRRSTARTWTWSATCSTRRRSRSRTPSSWASSSVQLEEVQQLQHYIGGDLRVLARRHRGARRRAPDRLGQRGLRGPGEPGPANRSSGRSLETVLPVRPLPAPGEGMVEASWHDPAGSERYLQLSLASFEKGLYVLVALDVSERVAMENALREKDRLAALGMLAAGVAHEVNTPITGISSYAQMLLEETAPEPIRTTKS